MRAFNVCLVLVLLVSLSLAACSQAAAPAAGSTSTASGGKSQASQWQQQWQTLVDAAKAEGTLTIYSDAGPQVRDALGKAFKEKFGIDVEYVAGSGDELTRKMLAERTAGQGYGDIYISGLSSSLNMLKPQGVLDPIQPALILPEVLDASVWKMGRVPLVDKDGTALALIATYTFYFLVNTDQVKPEEITSLDDLLQPKWKGKMLLYDPTVPGPGGAVPAYLYMTIGKDATDTFMRKLVDQQVVILRDRRQQIEWVAQGKNPIGIGTHPETVAQFMGVGAHVHPARTKEGALMQTVGGGMQALSKDPHPNARAVFLNWVLTREGSTVFSRAFGHPSSRKDVPPEGVNPIFIPRPQDKVVFENEEYYSQQPKMFATMKEIFASLLK